MKLFKLFPHKQRTIARPLKLNITGGITEKTYHYVSDMLLNCPNPSKIILVINSPGGNTRDALAIYDLLINSKSKITTIAIGNCCSAATILFALGSTRLIAHNTKYLLHQGRFTPANDCHFKVCDLQKIISNIKELDEMVKSKLRATCSKNIDDVLETIFNSPDDTVLTCEETINLGLATNIFDQASSPI